MPNLCLVCFALVWTLLGRMMISQIESCLGRTKSWNSTMQKERGYSNGGERQQAASEPMMMNGCKILILGGLLMKF
jgi:hypothetical protein